LPPSSNSKVEGPRCDEALIEIYDLQNWVGSVERWTRSVAICHIFAMGITRRANYEKSKMHTRALRSCFSLVLLAAAIVVPAARAQQMEIRVVVLQSQDKAMVDSIPLAAKEIVPHLVAGRSTEQARLFMVEIRSCKGVPADTIQALMREIQKNNFIVVIDLKEPDARLCSSRPS
jgi:hypothetical protein